MSQRNLYWLVGMIFVAASLVGSGILTTLVSLGIAATFIYLSSITEY